MIGHNSYQSAWQISVINFKSPQVSICYFIHSHGFIAFFNFYTLNLLIKVWFIEIQKVFSCIGIILIRSPASSQLRPFRYFQHNGVIISYLNKASCSIP